MTILTEHNKFWLSQNGKRVKLNGIVHVIKVTSFRASYPYYHDVIDVSAIPINKESKYYQTIKRELKDDWSTDILASDPEVEFEVRQQVGK
jgi:4'-phosphopantetheinyl transferase EntD